VEELDVVTVDVAGVVPARGGGPGVTPAAGELVVTWLEAAVLAHLGLLVASGEAGCLPVHPTLLATGDSLCPLADTSGDVLPTRPGPALRTRRA
jgi:hypothetical protein